MNAYRKKLESFKAAIGPDFGNYNFAKMHNTLRSTPAMEAGVTDHAWSLEEIIGLIC
jgi:hypothetical protein